MKDHRDYRVLYWTPEMDGPWSDAAAQRYLDGAYEGVHYRMPRGTRHATLEFLRPLPDLRYLNVEGPVVDDSAVNMIETLEHLTLLTRSTVPLAVDRLHRLHALAATTRPDMTAIRPLANLRHLYLAGPLGPDLSFLGDKPALRWLRLDGRPGRLSLAGIEACTALEDLEAFDHRIASLAPLRGVVALERLVFSGPRTIPPDNDLDLNDLAGMTHLHALRLINAGMIRSLGPLRYLPELRDLRLNEIAIADGDLGPLFGLPSWVGVYPPQRFIDDTSRYSHTVEQLRTLPPPR